MKCRHQQCESDHRRTENSDYWVEWRGGCASGYLLPRPHHPPEAMVTVSTAKWSDPKSAQCLFEIGPASGQVEMGAKTTRANSRGQNGAYGFWKLHPAPTALWKTRCNCKRRGFGDAFWRFLEPSSAFQAAKRAQPENDQYFFKWLMWDGRTLSWSIMDTNFYLISCNFLSADPTTVQSKTARRREAKFQLKTNCQCTRAATRFLRHPPRCPSCIARHNIRTMIADVRRLRYARHATKRVIDSPEAWRRKRWVRGQPPRFSVFRTGVVFKSHCHPCLRCRQCWNFNARVGEQVWHRTSSWASVYFHRLWRFHLRQTDRSSLAASRVP